MQWYWRCLRQTMAELMRQVEINQFSGPDLDNRRDICSSNSFASSMTLDMVRPTHTFSLLYPSYSFVYALFHRSYRVAPLQLWKRHVS